MGNPKLRVSTPLTPMTRVVMREKNGRFSVVREFFEAEKAGEAIIADNLTREWASIQMEEEHTKELEERRENEGW